MNNAKMWLVVKPTVGVPLFLTGVAVGSFAVHVAVLTNTGWVGDFLKGNELGSSDMASATILDDADPNVAKASYVLDAPDGAKEVTIVLPDGTTARAILQPDVMAAN